jgi:hypothetical protein
MEPEKDVFEEWAEEHDKKNPFKKFILKLKFFWEDKIRYFHREIIKGIKNTIYWFPIIWKDRNWDSYYIFEIMKHKLKAQSNYIGTRNRHTTSKRDAEIMLICVKLMELIQDEFYSSEYSDYHKTKHWFEDIDDRPGYSSWKSRLLEENFDDYFKKYPLVYKRVLNGEGWLSREGREDDKQIIAMNMGYINHSRAKRLLFKLMERNIESWWD